jgi:hypothetical protein
VFDVLQPDQKLALLADVALALRDPAVPIPRHTAANEGAIAAVFDTLRLLLQLELDETPSEDSPSTAIRSLILAAIADGDEPPEELPEPTAGNWEVWEDVLEVIEGRIFWDADYEMGDAFLDRPPEEAHELLALMTIDPEYYTAIPREPDRAGLIAVRQTLARLLGRPVPNEDGGYSALEDLYHDLTVGPCSEEDIKAYKDQAWIDVSSSTEPRWECDLATWVAEFREAVPTTPFNLNPPRTARVVGDWPNDVRVEQHGNSWVLQDDRGDFWCDVVLNCWTGDPEEGILTFPSRGEAEAAYRQANQMYAERAARRKAALLRLGRPAENVE